MTYKYLKSGSDDSVKVQVTDLILRISDNALIPFDEDNTDYQEYLAWVAEGNTAEAAD
tara:strand:- start:190 stop:363 length:174 start_codon:yes stop_codon:yes gene_type:complete